MGTRRYYVTIGRLDNRGNFRWGDPSGYTGYGIPTSAHSMKAAAEEVSGGPVIPARDIEIGGSHYSGWREDDGYRYFRKSQDLMETPEDLFIVYQVGATRGKI